MATNTVKYYINQVGIETGNYRVHLDFEGNFNNSSYYNSRYGTTPFSGTALNNFNGSGTFNSTNFLKITGITGIDSEFWTQYFVTAKNNREDGVLFSNFGGSGLYSGYTIGINAANKLYFETYSNLGPVVRTFNPILANKNIFAISRLSDDIIFYLLNQNTKEIISENYNINSFMAPSNEWYLGTCTGNQSYQNYSNFSGYIDEWIYMNESNAPDDIAGVMSGLYQRYNNNNFYFEVTGFNSYATGSLVSGNPSGIGLDASGTFNYSGLLSYDTGSAFIINDLGFLTGFGNTIDTCNETIYFYTYLNYTGIVEGNTFIPLTGELFLTSSISGEMAYQMPTGSFFTGITGYITGLYPVFTGVTGSSVVFSGWLTDNCGNVQGTYTTVEFSGVLSGQNVIPLTGLIASGLQETTYSESNSNFNINYVVAPAYYTDDGYIYSLGMNGLNYIRSIDIIDDHEIYLHHTKHNDITFNNIGQFDTIESGFVLYSDFTLSGTNLYLNGIGEIGSGVSVINESYNFSIIYSGDYFVSGENVLVSPTYDVNDNIIYDIYSGQRDYTIKTIEVIQNINSHNSFLFLNGQKLRSGIEYLSSGMETRLIDNDLLTISGNLFTFPQNNGIRFTGLSYITSLLASPFARGTSQLFLNGQRMEINNDYLEISNVDLLTGSGAFLSNFINSYNNEGNFWK